MGLAEGENICMICLPCASGGDLKRTDCGPRIRGSVIKLPFESVILHARVHLMSLKTT